MSDSASGAAAAETGAATPTVTDWSDDGSTTVTDEEGGEPDAVDASARSVEVGGDGETASISVPDDATDEEVAAIAAAVCAYLQDEARNEESTSARTGDPWRLSARLLQTGRRPAAEPRQLPDDQWVAAGRVR